MKRIFAALVWVVCVSPAFADTAFVTGETLGTLRNNATITAGFYFLANQNITVTQLGRWVVSGNSGTHTVALYNSACTSLGSVSVNTSGATAGQFEYATLGSSVNLTRGNVYFVMSAETNGGDQWYGNTGTGATPTAVTTTSAGLVISLAYDTCTNSGGSIGSYSYGPVSFQYTGGSGVSCTEISTSPPTFALTYIGGGSGNFPTDCAGAGATAGTYTIDAIGAGGSGVSASGTFTGTGGCGGAWSEATGVVISSTIGYNVGGGGAPGIQVGNGNTGGSTYVGASCSGGSVCAVGGGGSAGNGAACTQALASNGVGSTKYNGGTSAGGGTAGWGGNGGGSAANQYGPGCSQTSGNNPNHTGYGGAGTGNNSDNDCSTGGGNVGASGVGGKAEDGTAGGAAGTSGNNGGNGSHGSGGGGGYGTGTAGSATAGGIGGNGIEYSSSPAFGSGGGGGAGGGVSATSAASGGFGGNYGGGGGAAGFSSNQAFSGAGGDGLLVFIQTATANSLFFTRPPP